MYIYVYVRVVFFVFISIACIVWKYPTSHSNTCIRLLTSRLGAVYLNTMFHISDIMLLGAFKFMSSDLKEVGGSSVYVYSVYACVCVYMCVYMLVKVYVCMKFLFVRIYDDNNVKIHTFDYLCVSASVRQHTKNM